ncbi:MAG: DegT/DnrJ/EryC1/StrS family aminotransferase [Pirellulaceae bacterium]
MIPLCDLTAQYESLRDEIDAAMRSVAASGHYILGPRVKKFEQKIASYCGVDYAVGVGNGTDALYLALRALQIGPGDEVITTPFTFIATSEAICLAGAKPVFVDIDPSTYNMDPEQLEAAITTKTRAILPVHLYGQPCRMDAVLDIARRHNLRVVEDCAQSLGAAYCGRKTGTFGDIGCFSFFPSKNLGCFGDGGMVTTNDPELFERLEILRRHGAKVKYHHTEVGVNSRLDELQAAILSVKLPHLDNWTASRRRHAYAYNRLLRDRENVQCPSEWTTSGPEVVLSEDSSHAQHNYCCYHQYTVLVGDRAAAQKSLDESGVGHCVYYPVPLHLQEVHANLGYRPGDFPNAENVAQRCLSLPMFPELLPQQRERTVSVLLDSQKATSLAAA